MDKWFEYLFLALSWAIFYSLHSFLASSKLKRILEGKLGSSMKWYRLFYSGVSTILILGILYQSLLISSFRLIAPNDLLTYLGYMLATFGTIILVKSSKAISLSKFLGFKKEIIRSDDLITIGVYSKIRHPLYAGLLLIFLGYLFVSGTLSSVVHLLCLVIYLPFGIYFEEQNLIALFGDKYLNYSKQVPSLLPKIRKNKRA